MNKLRMVVATLLAVVTAFLKFIVGKESIVAETAKPALNSAMSSFPVGSIPLTGSAFGYKYLWSDSGASSLPSSVSVDQNRPVEVFKYLARL